MAVRNPGSAQEDAGFEAFGYGKCKWVRETRSLPYYARVMLSVFVRWFTAQHSRHGVEKTPCRPEHALAKSAKRFLLLFTPFWRLNCSSGSASYCRNHDAISQASGRPRLGTRASARLLTPTHPILPPPRPDLSYWLSIKPVARLGKYHCACSSSKQASWEGASCRPWPNP